MLFDTYIYSKARFAGLTIRKDVYKGSFLLRGR